MPAIAEGQVFASLPEFKQALREWAIERNFTPHILDSDSHRVRAGCRTAPDCPFRIRANYNEKRRNAKVTTVDDHHTCVATSEQRVSQKIKRVEVGKLKFLLEAVPKLINVDRKTKTETIVRAIETKYGQTISVRQAQKVRQGLSQGLCRVCNQAGHNRRECPQRQISTPDGAAAENGDLPEDLVNYADGEMDDNMSEEDRPRKPTHCSICFQTGHNRKNCPQEDRADVAQAGNSATSGDQPDLASTALVSNGLQDRVPLDPSLTNGLHPTIQRMLPRVQAHGNPGTSITESEQTTIAENGPVMTSQATALKASSLMEEAAKLMNEAARLHNEAKELTDSLINS